MNSHSKPAVRRDPLVRTERALDATAQWPQLDRWKVAVALLALLCLLAETRIVTAQCAGCTALYQSSLAECHESYMSDPLALGACVLEAGAAWFECIAPCLPTPVPAEICLLPCDRLVSLEPYPLLPAPSVAYVEDPRLLVVELMDPLGLVREVEFFITMFDPAAGTRVRSLGVDGSPADGFHIRLRPFDLTWLALNQNVILHVEARDALERTVGVAAKVVPVRNCRMRFNGISPASLSDRTVYLPE